MARLVIKATQPDDAARTRLRPQYAENPDSLVAVAHVVAVEFATIAAASNSPAPWCRRGLGVRAVRPVRSRSAAQPERPAQRPGAPLRSRDFSGTFSAVRGTSQGLSAA
ncbi:hypothetical protein HYQ63_12795 [Streptomyces sp. Rer75]|nr:hypothetical protein HYQ63_12795 [Streptomyces sp. Rer75]